MLEIVEPGWSTTVQDGGRPGLASIGVAPSGALDTGLHHLVNRLVGNHEDAPVLETAGGLRLVATAACVVATSAEAAVGALRAGDELVVNPARRHMWAYVAVRGGLAVDRVLGSASQDTLSGLGPPPLRAGTRLLFGPDPGTALVVDQASVASSSGPVVVWPGPRADWFGPDAFEQFVSARWLMSSQVSRVGVRLDGPLRRRAITGELPSEGVVTGSIQVPPDGRPIVLLADRPTTGGYPVIAVVDPASLPVLVQTRPGSAVDLRPADCHARLTLHR